MPMFRSTSVVCTPIIYLGIISAVAINNPLCDAGLQLGLRLPFPTDAPPEESSPPVRVRPSVPPATAPPPSPKSDDVGAKSSAVDDACLKRAIDTEKAKYAFDAKAFTNANRAKATRAFDAAKVKYAAARKKRNSIVDEERDENFEKRSSGEKPPTPPTMPKFETWADRMKAEVKAEGTQSYEDSVKRGAPLPAPGHPLDGPKLTAFVKEFRGTITDARLLVLIDQISKEYQTNVAKAALDAAKPQSETAQTKPKP